ncbi:hypothetical protein GGR22_003419 [Flavobacterium gossypii]|uniref:DUF4133 domain-containing protein n=1 Tax=Flavobacterium gossypii TaxID=1646119 RepID=A0ABR6DU68_9FLAO|nr:hypothetical protein [Flavobacterium gossypii]MBA9075236.1 hypothetical protein [Flavobacterium gossypii]
MKSILRSIAIGILIGALAFFAFQLVITFLIIGGIIMLLSRRRFDRRAFGNERFGGHRFAFADKIRNMNDEEYDSFKKRFENRSCRNRNKTTEQL